MPRSYRCPRPVHELGEKILRGCSDYFDRKIEPAPHEGSVEYISRIGDSIGLVDPTRSCLMIARTNFQAARFSNLLNNAMTPWRPTRGFGGWQAPKRNNAMKALMYMQDGNYCSWEEWQDIIEYIPQKLKDSNIVLLVKGTKSRWEASDFKPPADIAYAKDLAIFGATPELIEIITSGRWVNLLDNAKRYVSAVRKWGSDVVDGEVPGAGIRVGTIHSVKGQEADDVILLTTGSENVSRVLDTVAGVDEERRLAYVGATRARKRLFVVNERNVQNRIPFE